MRVNFTDEEIIYLYGILLKGLEELEKQKKLNRDNIKLHKRLITSLEKDNPQLKMLTRLHHQEKTSQSQKA